jgi:hypothetical protein
MERKRMTLDEAYEKKADVTFSVGRAMHAMQQPDVFVLHIDAMTYDPDAENPPSTAEHFAVVGVQLEQVRVFEVDSDQHTGIGLSKRDARYLYECLKRCFEGEQDGE